MNDLKKLDYHSCRSRPVDHRLALVTTPLKIPAWKERLRHHHDHEYARYITTGLEHGFHIGIEAAANLTPATQNMMSARQNPSVIQDYLEKEVEQGNILGPFTTSDAPRVHINRFGAIPKKHQPGRWRLITDLSFPVGTSVNDAIDPRPCSMAYVSVDQVAGQALTLGKGSLLAKIDVKSAYRLIPICPSDRMQLGMRWNNAIYVDGKLPFGLRSAPKIFNALADGLEWCVSKEEVPYIYHYLDDFIVLGPPGSPVCSQSLLTLKQLCSELNIPLAEDKQDGPTPVITFLGIVIDTVRGELRLPEDKLRRLTEAVQQWLGRKSCTRRELESLIGVLHHACKVTAQAGHFCGEQSPYLALSSVGTTTSGSIKISDLTLHGGKCLPHHGMGPP